MTTSPEALREAQRDLALVLEAYGADWKPDPHAPDTIYGPSLKGGVARLADVRGWGYLTGGGHGALGLPGEKAREIQDALGRLIASIPAMVSALQEARADADLCASSWTKEIEARNATASIARRFHAALQEIASGEVGPEQEGHYLAHRRAVKTARKAIGALSPGGADAE